MCYRVCNWHTYLLQDKFESYIFHGSSAKCIMTAMKIFLAETSKLLGEFYLKHHAQKILRYGSSHEIIPDYGTLAPAGCERRL